MKQYPESLSFDGVDPVAGWDRVLEVVAAPTGQAVRFFAATEGSGSAWLARSEAETLIRFLQQWLDRPVGKTNAAPPRM